MGKDLPTLQMRAQRNVHLVNTSADELTVANNAYLASFGRGSFKLLPGDSEPAANQTEYVLTNHDDLVVFNGIVMSLGKVVADERSKKPGASLAYHSLTLDESNPKLFSASCTHRVPFTPKEEAGSVLNIGNIGSKEDKNIWNSKCSRVFWNVRWTAKGLMPIKPAIYLHGGQLVLAAGRACHLNPAP